MPMCRIKRCDPTLSGGTQVVQQWNSMTVFLNDQGSRSEQEIRRQAPMYGNSEDEENTELNGRMTARTEVDFGSVEGCCCEGRSVPH